MDSKKVISMVATVLTACGIETCRGKISRHRLLQLQQCLPLAVLKRIIPHTGFIFCLVATVLTACGIETNSLAKQQRVLSVLQQCLPLAVLKHGICERA